MLSFIDSKFDSISVKHSDSVKLLLLYGQKFVDILSIYDCLTWHNNGELSKFIFL